MIPVTLADLEEEVRAALADDDADALARLDVEMSRLEVEPKPVSLVSAALWYAKQGLHVFPLQPGSKVPMPKSRGCKDGTTDVEQVRAWWTATPDANVAIATGHLVDVIDIDGPVGNKSIAPILGDLPALLGRVSTPRPGGRHLYVKAVEGRGNRAKLLPGVDYRGLGGYVVAPPSINEQGAYLWVVPLDLERSSS